MLRLAEARRTGQPFDRVRGLCVRRPDGEIVANGTAEVVPDLDDLPSPARDQFLLHGGRLGDDFSCLRVSTSRGCTSACTFCNAPHAGNRMGPVKVWRGMSAERVVDEVALLRRRFHCDSIEFVDSTFEDPGGGARAKQRVYEIAAGLLRRGLDVSWRCTMQACHWSEADLPLLHTLRESGLARVLVGIESGSDAGLRLWGKRSTVADNLRIVDLLARCHIGLDCGFIALHPYVSFDEMRANVAFLRHTGGHLLRRFGSRLELYPAAAVVRRLRADGLLLDHFDSTWDCMAYRFADERVEQLASALESLAPLDTASAALEVAEWAAWQRLSRARRRSDTSTQLVEAAEARHAAVLRRLAQQHADVFLDWIESAEMSRVDVAAIERQTASAVQAMRDAAQKLATLPADLEPSIHPALAAVGA